MSIPEDPATFEFADEIAALRRELGQAKSRTARTLVRNAGMSVTLVGIQPGGGLSEHTAPGPITIHVLEGIIGFEAAGRQATLSGGMLLSLDAGIPHAVASATGGIFLLTLAIPARAGSASRLPAEG